MRHKFDRAHALGAIAQRRLSAERHLSQVMVMGDGRGDDDGVTGYIIGDDCIAYEAIQRAVAVLNEALQLFDDCLGYKKPEE